MKKVYCVRHGETNANRENIVQGLHNELSERGMRQAIQIAERAKGISFSRLISSDAVRTRDTAQKIADATGTSIEFSELFREIKRPDSMIGIARNTKRYKEFLLMEDDHLAEKDWRYEDGETFFDAQERAHRALAYLEDIEDEEILVVTHGHFLRHLAFAILMQKHILPEVWRMFSTSLPTSNTGVSVFLHSEEHWRLFTWNDHAHFAE